jgi:2'-hydroxyisoflavone reductase
MSTRRDFLLRAAAVGASLVATRTGAQSGSAAAPDPLRILILGGTGNIGPYFVRAAVARGHHVSVFSRGITQAIFPANVERLIGDRSKDLASTTNRDWDAVIDVATFGPGWVRSLGEAIRDRTKHYTFVSTLSVYDNPSANNQTDEDSPVLSYGGSADPYSIEENAEHYGALKVLCEMEAQKQFAGRTVVLRPGFIAGPDETHGVLTFWAARGGMGGELLAAGEPSTPVQYIDVRDMAEWTVRLAERQVTGIYNAVSPIHDLARVIGAAVSASTPSGVTWVHSEWLATQRGPGNWGTLRFWEMNEGHITRMSNARAVASGLTCRPVRTTLADTLAWYRQQPAEAQAVLNAGFERDARTGRFAQALTRWPAYLDREREVLAAWHAERAA